MEKVFDQEDVADPHRVKFACIKLRGHATLWWEQLQKDRVLKKLEKIQTWDEMVSKMKGKFLPSYYHQRIIHDFQNHKQREKTMSEYTEEFFKLSIRSEREEDEEELTTRYVNGLSFTIQDEMTTQLVTTVDKAYQLDLRVEEKLARQSRKRYYVRYGQAGGWKQ